MGIDRKDEVLSTPSKSSDVRKIRVLWFGLVFYFLLLLNALRFVHALPYQLLILAALLNGAIIITIVVAMRRVYRRLHN